MQKFHSKMTPRSLYTQFPLTEITYAKVCILWGKLVHPALLLPNFVKKGSKMFARTR